MDRLVTALEPNHGGYSRCPKISESTTSNHIRALSAGIFAVILMLLFPSNSLDLFADCRGRDCIHFHLDPVGNDERGADPSRGDENLDNPRIAVALVSLKCEDNY